MKQNIGLKINPVVNKNIQSIDSMAYKYLSKMDFLHLGCGVEFL